MLVARLNSLLKNAKPRIPRRLKPPGDDKSKKAATAQLKLRPFKTVQIEFFSKL
ncbi:MAG: hypothetical protein WCC87_12115 [Candidatus Korobacteraceae bacterium]